MERLFFNILSSDVEKTRDFYVNLLGMRVHFDSDWFVILKPQGDSSFELGIIDENHETVPVSAKGNAAGLYPTFVVDDVEVVHEHAVEMGCDIIEPPTDMFYGQRRLLVRDPNGIVADISSLSD